MKFDVFNRGSTPLTDLILEISIVETSAAKELAARTLVRPFQIRGNVVLQAGYTIDYEMLPSEFVVGLEMRRECRCRFLSLAARGELAMVRPSNTV